MAVQWIGGERSSLYETISSGFWRSGGRVCAADCFLFFAFCEKPLGWMRRYGSGL